MALNKISVKCQNVIKGMLTVDPVKRISWEELFRIFEVNSQTSTFYLPQVSPVKRTRGRSSNRVVPKNKL